MTELANFEAIHLILVLNSPLPEELEIAERWRLRFPNSVTVVSTERESVSASTNRGYQLARSEFLAYADVDDLKAPGCYSSQAKTLLDDPRVDFTYGDFLVVPAHGATEGRRVVTPDFDRVQFLRSSFVGSNHFFRRRLLEKCGLWDEQLRSGGDFDFQIRAARQGNFRKTEGLLGYYTCAPFSDSASSGRLQPTERTVIELRYGIFDKIDYRYERDAKKYRVRELQFGGAWHAVGDYFPDYERHLAEAEKLRTVGVRRYRRMRVSEAISKARRAPRTGRAPLTGGGSS